MITVLVGCIALALGVWIGRLGRGWVCVRCEGEQAREEERQSVRERGAQPWPGPAFDEVPAAIIPVKITEEILFVAPLWQLGHGGEVEHEFLALGRRGKVLFQVHHGRADVLSARWAVEKSQDIWMDVYRSEHPPGTNVSWRPTESPKSEV